ncbi:hypothetical protein [Sphingomonas radiodurans]|uniref:hypothetical protein n=1 Tax=Sphingomonas radiodurans TaxID=2890321 RepID=UPI001E41D5B1|nr:hypothetical protein [Sphingomonas radiodurans]WBH15897.1 hypothetical protein LLW23_13945 [Sphingomonas radiodurans]
MAYLAFSEIDTISGQVARAVEPKPAEATGASLSALEWLVVAVAKRDRMSSLRQPGRLTVAMGSLFGPQRNPRLADERLEALRRIAVLSWHYGYVVPGSEVTRFLAAGFAPEQYELVVDSISADRLAHRAERFRR